MLKKGLFKKPNNELEGYDKVTKVVDPAIPYEMCVSCPDCKKIVFSGELIEHDNVCPNCGHHFRMNARSRISFIADEGSFEELFVDATSSNLLDFPGYDKKLSGAKLESSENEAVICGSCKINGEETMLFVMDPYFMMGSMGTVVGEKITRIFELAIERNLPVVGFTVSGGARMQEGILSLMQMAKTSGAVKLHSDRGGFYLACLTDPTTGGVTASFAMEADVIIAEPRALIGFAGPRVIEQTIRQKLPNGFQRAEFLRDKGFVDEVVPRKAQKEFISLLIKMHTKGGAAK